MPTKQAAAKLSVKQLLDAVKRLSDDERLEFERGFKKLQSRSSGDKQRSNEKRAETEADLLARISVNSRLPEAAQRRFNRLRRKLQNETISESELTEYQVLVSRSEWMTGERLEALIELARMRGTDVKTLMRKLGLNRRAY